MADENVKSGITQSDNTLESSQANNTVDVIDAHGEGSHAAFLGEGSLNMVNDYNAHSAADASSMHDSFGTLISVDDVVGEGGYDVGIGEEFAEIIQDNDEEPYETSQADALDSTYASETNSAVAAGYGYEANVAEAELYHFSVENESVDNASADSNSLYQNSADTKSDSSYLSEDQTDNDAFDNDVGASLSDNDFLF